MVHLILYREKMREGVTKDVHLNLSIALLLSLVILLVGLELARNIRVSYRIHISLG